MQTVMPDAWTYEAEAATCVCGGSDTAGTINCRDEVSGLPFRYERCPHCGIDRLDPRPVARDILQFYPKVYHAYQASYGEGETKRRWLERLIVNTFYARKSPASAIAYLPLKLLLWPLRRWPVLAFPEPDFKSVYEFGAATGGDLTTFRNAGWRTSGCEPSQQACEVAHSRGFELECATAEQATLEPAAYSCVLMNNVFEHLYDPADVLSKIRSGLVAGGRVILIVPNHDSWSAKGLRGYWAGYEAPRHIYGYSPRTMKKQLGEFGFQVEYVQHRPALRWLWRRAALPWLADRGIYGKRAVLLANSFTVAMTPVAILSAILRRADFIKVVARKAEQPRHDQAS
jgi:SAM-dependent methyltransferase